MKNLINRHQLDREAADRISKNTRTRIDGDSITSQSERDNTDLNILVRRFGIGVVARPIDPSTYGTWDGTLDLQQALEVVSNANDAFMALPARTRERFKNDPLELLAAIKDPAMHGTLRELGIFKAEELEPPTTRTDPPPGGEDTAKT